MALTPEQRSIRAKIAANARWAQEKDRQAATAKQRAAAMERFEREVDPGGTLDPETRARLAASARKAYFSRLALASSKARSRAKGGSVDDKYKVAIDAVVEWARKEELATIEWGRRHNPECECEVEATTLELIAKVRDLIRKAGVNFGSDTPE